MATDEGEDLARVGTRVLDDEVASAGEVGDVVEDQGAAAGGGAEGEEDVHDMLHRPVLFRDKLRRVVLEVFGFADQLREKGHEGISVQIA